MLKLLHGSKQVYLQKKSSKPPNITLAPAVIHFYSGKVAMKLENIVFRVKNTFFTYKKW